MATSKTSSIVTLDDAPEQAVAQAAEQAQAAVNVAGKNNDPTLSKKFAVINIHASDDEHGNDAVFLGINGYAYQIPRGVPCRVPVEAVEILKTAVKKVYPTNGGIVIGEREVPRYAFSVISQDA